ncbi:AAA family ATPase [Actinoalloteichus caeruleus]|uniref:AAA domain-containing protein, putative AbiEii toxin, Type IV TA system n=1 Tax=Actinoalloteichus caeruleus DSM 43889 TaxID=1120930 RepID=A0ABT1JNU7_ACTCY|nr:ATP-binding protein [Actinoalloteichus caeruleus]MCP2333811.1 AAA domain-containing protein, putative AbiEii toxin, Type IV TA system [Actinoalloteichus caeruleus DSM 43889]
MVRGRRSGGPYLSTEERENGTVINVHGDGGSRGKPQPRAAARTGRTVLSTVTTNDYPTILAARREMRSWRRLALEPSALRAPDAFSAPRSMSTSGKHLASTLHRIATEKAGGAAGQDDPEAVFARVVDRLTDLVGVGAERLAVEPDPVREVFTLFLQEKGGFRLPARGLSEGTLRFLALCVLMEDPTFTGLICVEEPENGVNPANLSAVVDLIRDLAVDASEEPDPDNPFRQVIVNTHSPGVVRQCSQDDLLLADLRPRRLPDGRIVSALSLLPFRRSWRDRANDGRGESFSEVDVLAYLVTPPGAQTQLFEEGLA